MNILERFSFTRNKNVLREFQTEDRNGKSKINFL